MKEDVEQFYGKRGRELDLSFRINTKEKTLSGLSSYTRRGRPFISISSIGVRNNCKCFSYCVS